MLACVSLGKEVVCWLGSWLSAFLEVGFEGGREDSGPDVGVRRVGVGCGDREERGVPAGEGRGRLIAHDEGGEC